MSMDLSSWLCSNNSRNMLVKIVHPGGHVDLHDRPVLASDIMRLNPRCVVAYPHVFQEPWAIVSPETVLMLGQKFFVVPIGTIRKLQRLSYKHSPYPAAQQTGTSNPKKDSNCWFSIKKKNYMKHPNDECFSKDNCLKFLTSWLKSKTSEKSSSFGSSETNGLNRKKLEDLKGPPKRFTSFGNWQPNLESISEEESNHNIL